ncbi:erythroblast NAD(P)(+)--arginine ADP-ribosyltransferase-like [Megalobrama amblycephala]|uniref:erythroblast NAD(P)(+)--arginine ADP-ribosyltransferase-like n=1 Tax=Megalobrama amblycephala TaxID=75352 RepID=UPI0020146450|nr:erythroblast NAD(P)(+)--arginine ADP-ribosyltransferase-like [Megalobrama amblycephala]
MLLIIEALLLISSALGRDHRDDDNTYTLNMAPQSVDDQYKGCKENMKKDVETKYLKNELDTSPTFNAAWKKVKVEPPYDILSKDHKIAIYVYSDASVYNDFNSDTRSGKEQYKNKKYKWYSLYFLLTDAIQILKSKTEQENKCYSTCRRTKVKFNENALNTEVRFGSLASSSPCPKKKIFGDESCFEIYTCEGADVSKYSKLPEEKEVLIPPYEKFKVKAVKKRKDYKDLWCETVFVLNTTGTISNLNCAVAQKDKANL